MSGFGPVRPAISFAHFGFDSHLMGVIRKSEYSTPTPIQAQVDKILIFFLKSSIIYI